MSNPFDKCSQEYVRHRPDYPRELYDRIMARCGLSAGSVLADIGAGTGKASVPWLERGLSVVCVEPSSPMIEQGVQSYPTLRYVCSTAENIPLASDTFDVVSSAQSFHWFDVQKTLPEFARILGPGGHLAVFWNTWDLVEHTQAFEKLVSTFNPQHERTYRTKDWKTIIESTGHFRVIDQPQFSFVAPRSVDDWAGIARSTSYIRVIGDARMVEFEAALRESFARFENVDCPYRTALWLAEKADYRRR